MRHFHEKSVQSIVMDYFNSAMLCECNISKLRNQLGEFTSSLETDKIMAKLFFESMLLSVVHFYRKDLYDSYARTLDYEARIFMHGGANRIYRPFAESLSGSLIAREGLFVLTNWAKDVQSQFGRRVAQELITAFQDDKMIQWNLKKVMSENEYLEFMRELGDLRL